jgi:hypothetical protein
MSQQSSNDLVPARNSHSFHHCVASIFYAVLVGKDGKMVIATVLFSAFVIATGVAIVKAYEWHQDVLYGPYLKRID